MAEADSHLLGVMMDMSGSMQAALEEDGLPQEEALARADQMFPVLSEIIYQALLLPQQKDTAALAVAFGLRNEPFCCDLLYFLERAQTEPVHISERSQACDETLCESSHVFEDILGLLKDKGAPGIKAWTDAQQVSRVFAHEFDEDTVDGWASEMLLKMRSQPDTLQKIVELLPSVTKGTLVGRLASGSANKWNNSTNREQLAALFAQGGACRSHTVSSVCHTMSSVFAADVCATDKDISDHVHRAVALLWGLQSKLEPKPVATVAHWLKRPDGGTRDPCLRERAHKLEAKFKPFIYGQTNMCQALSQVLSAVERRKPDRNRVLFLVSDGQSTDGDPRELAEHLRTRFGMTIVCVHLVPARRGGDAKTLLSGTSTCPADLTNGAEVLFDMASKWPTTHRCIRLLHKYGWDIPPSGTVRLFVQVSRGQDLRCLATFAGQLSKSNDALVEFLGEYELTEYIEPGVRDETGDPRVSNQDGPTCWAHATAAVFHMALKRIHSRSGGHPKFNAILSDLLEEYGKDKAQSTEQVVRRRIHKYRPLRYTKLDSDDAVRMAINAGRPVLATFDLDDLQWGNFSAFYKRNKDGVLSRDDIMKKGTPLGEAGGHAVVLTSFDDHGYCFMNSWGENFGDGGFFSVRDLEVLGKMQFIDVFWLEEATDGGPALLVEEREAYRQKAAAEVAARVGPLCDRLDFQCPVCEQCSPVTDYQGTRCRATCPKCRQCFTPAAVDELLRMHLYLRKH